MKKIDAAGLVVRVRAIAPHSASGEVKVETIIENPTDAPRTFCDYHTPFEGIRNRIFVIRGADGGELEYQGMMAKRAPPDDEDYITLASGASRSATVDLRSAYDLSPGAYEVHFYGSGICGLPDSEPITIEVGP